RRDNKPSLHGLIRPKDIQDRFAGRVSYEIKDYPAPSAGKTSSLLRPRKDSKPSARCKPPSRKDESNHAAATASHRASFASDTPISASSLEPAVLHSLKWTANARSARCSQYSASASRFQARSGR